MAAAAYPVGERQNGIARLPHPSNILAASAPGILLPMARGEMIQPGAQGCPEPEVALTCCAPPPVASRFGGWR